MYRMDFAGGDSIYADADHLWITTDHLWRKQRNRKGMSYAGWDVENTPLTTLEIKNTLTYGKRGDVSHSIPLSPPLDLPDVDLPIPPYVLGLWLGDGISRQGAITVSTKDVEHYREMLANMGEILHEPTPASMHDSAPTYPITKGRKHVKRGPQCLSSRLQSIGVLNNKHIPTLYLRSSYEQRMGLLRGLMDSDGYISPVGTAEFSSSNKRLANNTQELIHSLGLKTAFTSKVGKIYGKEYSMSYRVCFSPSGLKVVSLPRKQKRISTKSNQKNRTPQRMVKDVVDTNEYAEAICISVDSPTHMFLAGKSFIPTHNTWTVAMLLVIMGAQRPLRIACAREFQVSLRDSAKKTIEDAIERAGLSEFYNIQRNHIYGQNGTEFFFTGFEGSREAIRGWEGVDIVWVEEAQRMSWESREILYPSMRKPGCELWFTFNPQNRSDPVWQDFCVEGAREGIIKKVNWDQNPWLPEELKKERLICLKTEPERYEHIWNGDLDDEGLARRIMRYADLEECIDLHRKLESNGKNIDYAGRVHVGLDLADQGRDRNALVARRGPLVVNLQSFSSPTISNTVEEANRWCERYGASRLYYDAVGMGANVRSDILRVRKIEYAATGVMFGAGVQGKRRRYTFKNQE